MSFILTNVPTTFMRLINGILVSIFYYFVIINFYDICIYSKSDEENAGHLCIVMRILKEKRLYSKLSKYEFWLCSISVLGMWL